MSWREARRLGGIAITALLLGCVGITSVWWSIRDTASTWRQDPHPFWIYVAVLCLFHGLEFICTAVFSRDPAHSDAFLLNHSRAYHFCIACAVSEYWMEHLFFSWVPGGSVTRIVTNIVRFTGWICIISGQGLRSWAMLHAGPNFSHLLQLQRRADHMLVTTGPYR